MQVRLLMQRGICDPARDARFFANLHDREIAMIGWLVRPILIAAGAITGLLIAKDAPIFGLVQCMVAIMLIVLVVFVVAFWPARWTHFFDQLHKRPKA
jgi:hypothetical protein